MSEEPERDYLDEAKRILAGTTLLLPQVEHLRAVADSPRPGTLQFAAQAELYALREQNARFRDTAKAVVDWCKNHDTALVKIRDEGGQVLMVLWRELRSALADVPEPQQHTFMESGICARDGCNVRVLERDSYPCPTFLAIASAERERLLLDVLEAARWVTSCKEGVDEKACDGCSKRLWDAIAAYDAAQGVAK